MSTYGFAMELVNANNNGCNFVAGPWKNGILVYGYQVSGTISFITNTAPGTYIEGAVTGFFVNSAPTFTEPQGEGGGILSVTGDLDSPGSMISAANNGLTVVGNGLPVNGLLFNRFWNTVSPVPISFDITLFGLSEFIPKGSYLIIHAEQNAIIGNSPTNCPCDVQVTGTLFYR
jgi:hypothetical protein